MRIPNERDLGVFEPIKTGYKALNLDHVKMLAEYGHTDTFMCKFFGVTGKTWTHWKLKHKEFRTMLEAWRETANKRVVKALYERAIGYEHTEEKVFCQNGEVTTHEVVKRYPPSESAALAWLKNKDPKNWKDKQEVEVTGNMAEQILAARKRNKKKDDVDDLLG